MRVSLIEQATPMQPLRRLSDQLGVDDVWIKRDDVMGLGGGGNKVRKLEWLLGEALEQGADVVLTSGAVQSNHARLTAAGCARVGLDCELWLARAVPGRTVAYERTANPVLDRLFGADVHLLSGDDDPEAAARQRAATLSHTGRRPYVIPTGGSNAVGAYGYQLAAGEILRQAAEAGRDFGSIVVACGSGGTLAGLAAGLGDAGWPGQLIGISVSSPAGPAREKVAGLADQLSPRPVIVDLDDRFVGVDYGVPTDAGLDAIRLFARTEGVLLDPVYTGKAAAGLLTRLSERTAAGPVLFVHTGGFPALFAYPEEIS